MAAAERWERVTHTLRDRYRQTVGDDGPSEDEVREALHTIGSAAQAVLESVGSAMRDPETRDRVRDAATGLVSALGATFSQLAEELRKDPEASAEDGPD